MNCVYMVTLILVLFYLSNQGQATLSWKEGFTFGSGIGQNEAINLSHLSKEWDKMDHSHLEQG